MPAAWDSAGVRTPAAGAGAAMVTLHTGSVKRAYVTEIGFACNASTGSQFGLIRPNNTPVASTSAHGQAEDPQSPAATANLDTAWSTAPTITGQVYLRRYTTVDAIATGFGLVWTWDESSPLIVPASGWIVVWNFGAGSNSACDLYMRWYEEV